MAGLKIEGPCITGKLALILKCPSGFNHKSITLNDCTIQMTVALVSNIFSEYKHPAYDTSHY